MVTDRTNEWSMRYRPRLPTPVSDAWCHCMRVRIACNRSVLPLHATAHSVQTGRRFVTCACAQRARSPIDERAVRASQRWPRRTPARPFAVLLGDVVGRQPQELAQRGQSSLRIRRGRHLARCTFLRASRALDCAGLALLPAAFAPDCAVPAFDRIALAVDAIVDGIDSSPDAIRAGTGDVRPLHTNVLLRPSGTSSPPPAGPLPGCAPRTALPAAAASRR
jgi:hypothetical protein